MLKIRLSLQFISIHFIYGLRLSPSQNLPLIRLIVIILTAIVWFAVTLCVRHIANSIKFVLGVRKRGSLCLYGHQKATITGT